MDKFENIKYIEVRTSIIPKGYCAMAIWPFLLISKKHHLTINLLKHELTHFKQELELLIIPFFLWYGVEYLIKLIYYRNHINAYRAISFEREAVQNEYDLSFTFKDRRAFSFLKYVFVKH